MKRLGLDDAFTEGLMNRFYDVLDEKLLPIGTALAVGLNLCGLMKLLRQIKINGLM
jgi:hypothetical protein